MSDDSYWWESFTLFGNLAYKYWDGDTTKATISYNKHRHELYIDTWDCVTVPMYIIDELVFCYKRGK